MRHPIHRAWIDVIIKNRQFSWLRVIMASGLPRAYGSSGVWGSHSPSQWRDRSRLGLLYLLSVGTCFFYIIILRIRKKKSAVKA